ncbi:MAG: transcription termination/antitermination protein NusA, partial [Lentisphaeria bacterium]|nr:transcription termination/antitermination protein NusA [Lentisphaeria bacterium]
MPESSERTMNNSEFLSVLEYLEHERGIDRETLIVLIEESLSSAAQKVVHSEQEIRVRVDRSTGDIVCWAPVVVVKTVHNSGEEVSLADAKKLRPDVSVGDEIEWEVTPKDFGRIAAQTMKQTLTYGIRQAEKLNICEDFKDQLNQLLTGVVRRVEHGDVYIDFHQAEGVMRYNDRIPGEEYHPGEHITAILLDINADHP